MTGDVEDIPPVKDTVRKVLGGFLSKPVGKALQIEFENSGKIRWLKLQIQVKLIIQ